MGMAIDNTCEPKPMSKEEIVDTLKTMVFGVQAFERFNAKEREALDKAWNIIDQYEARLNADMVAMLTEIQLKLEELKSYDIDEVISKKACDIIQQKIDALKAESEGEDEDRN